MDLAKRPLLANWRITLMLCTVLIALLISLQAGQLKPFSDVDLLDVVGEASTLLLTAMTLLLIISSRPKGRVTNLFYIAGLLLCFSMSLDTLDEFIQYPQQLRLVSWLESLPQPVGFIILGFAAVEWYREQKMVHRQLLAREQNLRAQQWLDPLTTLYTKPYLMELLQRDIALQPLGKQPLTLVSFNLANFSRYNDEMGAAAGDELLQQFAQSMVSLLRLNDCMCRYHSDKFIVLMPATNQSQAWVLVRVLTAAVNRQLALPDYISIKSRVRAVNETDAQMALDALLSKPEETSNAQPMCNV